MKGQRKTRRYEVRLSEREQAIIKRAGELSSQSATADTSDIVRDAAVLLAEHYIKIKTGEYRVVDALGDYKALLEELLGDENEPGIAP